MVTVLPIGKDTELGLQVYLTPFLLLKPGRLMADRLFYKTLKGGKSNVKESKTYGSNPVTLG